MKLETDEEAYALHRYAKCHGISDEATFDIASWGYRMGLERAAKYVQDIEPNPMLTYSDIAAAIRETAHD